MKLTAKIFLSGLQDLLKVIPKLGLIGMLGRQDMTLRYRRSTLGPFWITISMCINILTMGLVFGQIFGSAMQELLPFLAIGLTLWSYISGAIEQGCTAFTSAEGIIRQIDLPCAFHILRMLWKNFLFFLHNAVIIPIAFLVMWHPITWDVFLCIPGFLLLSLNIAWMAVFCGVICTRFRDLPQVVSSILLVFFYLTPIIWMPALLPQRTSAILLTLNPFFHFLEIIRAPLMGTPTTFTNWAVSIVIAILGWIAALCLLGRYRGRIAYWL